MNKFEVDDIVKHTISGDEYIVCETYDNIEMALVKVPGRANYIRIKQDRLELVSVAAGVIKLKPKEPEVKLCECGSESLNLTIHTDYCPKG